jgi:D-lyxose ketol-isomerase
MREGIRFIKRLSFQLPPFAYWTIEDWQVKSGPEYEELRESMLGWDITDFGSGDFSKIGLLLFNLRNGSQKKGAKTYAEKILISQENQVTPLHFHFAKTEDIINRGGGRLLVQLYQANPDGSLAKDDVTVSTDGRNYKAGAGSIIRLQPGESITLKPGQYHKFWAEAGYGPVLIGEVSQVNDDRTDNRFYEKTGRFPAIEEDEPILYPLFSEVDQN